MSRIQQILAKAERDGTARRVGTLDEPPLEAPTIGYPSPMFEPRVGPHAAPQPIDSRTSTSVAEFSVVEVERSAFDPPPSSPERFDGDGVVQATLSPVLVAASQSPLGCGRAVPFAAWSYRAGREQPAPTRDSNHEPWQG